MTAAFFALSFPILVEREHSGKQKSETCDGRASVPKRADGLNLGGRLPADSAPETEGVLWEWRLQETLQHVTADKPRREEKEQPSWYLGEPNQR